MIQLAYTVKTATKCNCLINKKISIEKFQGVNKNYNKHKSILFLKVIRAQKLAIISNVSQSIVLNNSKWEVQRHCKNEDYVICHPKTILSLGAACTCNSISGFNATTDINCESYLNILGTSKRFYEYIQ